MAEDAGMDATVIRCDVSCDDSLAAAAETMAAGAKLHTLVHSIAYAPAAAMKGPFSSTTRADFSTAMDVSVFSLLAVTQAFLPCLVPADGEHSSLQALTYLGSSRVSHTVVSQHTVQSMIHSMQVAPDYAVMGPCKAALEASVRQLASELGPRGVTANSISAGPIKTLAARGITNFSELASSAQQRQLGSGVLSPAAVGAMSVFLGSPGAAAVTGQTLFVDNGFSAALQ